MILVTGASGFVGGRILKDCNGVIACPSLRNATEDDVKRIIESSGVDTVIHTAAISDIGACERDPEASHFANVEIPTYIARAAKNIKLICFSSDQVYGGSNHDGPYSEDMAMPANVYAKHKLEMEERVLDISPNAVMLRAEWMYGYYLKKPNYLMNVIGATDSIAISENQYRGITYVKEVSENVARIARLPGGVYNFGSETDDSMYQITERFLSLLGKKTTIIKAPPRHNLWMSCSKARAYGIEFSEVSDGLKRCAWDYGLI